MKVGLKETKSILMTIDEDGLMYAQLWEIFKIFSASQKEVEEESSVAASQASRHYTSVREIAGSSTKTMELLLLPSFMKYFKVSTDDEDYFEECISRLAYLNEVELYVQNGIKFQHLINELHECNFFVSCGLTEVEAHGCFNAQVFILLMEKIGLLADDTERISGFFRDVNDLCENVEVQNEEAYTRGR
jgi:hypothetical protein